MVRGRLKKGSNWGFLNVVISAISLLSSGSISRSCRKMSEVYSGLMLPMIAGSLPDFTSTFERYAADLKQEAEK